MGTRRRNGARPGAAQPSALTEQLDRAWSQFADEGSEAAAAWLAGLTARQREDPDVRLLSAAVQLERGYAREAWAELAARAAALATESEPLADYYRALALCDLGRFGEAEARLAALDPEDFAPGAIEYQRAVAAEFAGRTAAAEHHYAAAAAADPQAYRPPLRMASEAFAVALEEARAALPDELQAALADVPVVVEPAPPPAMLALLIDDGFAPDLLGLFVGRNLREESVFEVPDVPPAIYLFQRNLERAAGDRAELVAEIATTLYHELGHYLGLDEEDLKELGVD